MADCFLIRRALGGALTRLEPIADRGFRKTSLGKMIGQRLRLGGHAIRKPLFERSRNLTMQLLTTAPHQTSISSVLHERVLELISGIRWHTALEGQLRGDKLPERSRQVLLGKRGDGC